MFVPAVIQQHADDAAIQAMNRRRLVDSATASLQRLLRFDRRLAANFDGLRISGEPAWVVCEGALENPTPGSLFAMAVRALEDLDRARFGRAIAVAQADETTLESISAALEWVAPRHLHGLVADLLRDSDSFNRLLGVAACALHRTDPGSAVSRLAQDEDTAVRARALRAVGELGRVDMLAICGAAMQRDPEPDVRFWASWSAVLLGDRNAAIEALIGHWRAGRHTPRAFRLALASMRPRDAHQLLQSLANEPQQRRWLIQGCGIAGDAVYLPWLLKQMTDPETARIAGEAFALTTGADLGGEALDRPAPPDFESGPNDDPDDPDVAMDQDDDLSWPDPDAIEKWWAANQPRFTPGQRYFMGGPVTRAHCLDVLKNGYQRQRILAAHYLCLLEPGTPLFNTSAPAWRQQRLLDRMT